MPGTVWVARCQLKQMVSLVLRFSWGPELSPMPLIACVPVDGTGSNSGTKQRPCHVLLSCCFSQHVCDCAPLEGYTGTTVHVSHLLSILLTLVTAQCLTRGQEELGGLFQGSLHVFKPAWGTGTMGMAS